MTRRALAGGWAALLAAGLAGPACASAPVVENVQLAYEQARIDNAERHALDLVIQGAKCNEMKTGDYICQIDFVRRAEPEKRLYFDVVTLAQRQGQWMLTSGLCVTKPR